MASNKAKKGGMVIVIGVGKPSKKKKGDLKKSGPRRIGGGDKTKRATKSLFQEQMENNPNLLNERMERAGVDADFMNKYMEHTHNMSLNDAVKGGDVDIMAAIRRARGVKQQNAGSFHEDGRPKERLLALLRRRQVSPAAFRGSVQDRPFMDFQERIDQLAERAHERRNQQRQQQRGARRERNESEDPDDVLYEPSGEELGEDYEDDHDIVREYPEDTHTRTGGFSGRGSLFYEPASTASSTLPFASSGKTRRTPRATMRAPKGSVESETYGFGAANPYAPTSAGSEDEEADMDAVEQNMYGLKRTSSDSTNVMDAAWALLKGNPAMRDAEGRAINHPAAMVYDNLAAQIHLNEQNPFDERDGNPDDESAADVMEQMRKPTHQNALKRKPPRFLSTAGPSVFDAKMAMRNDKAEQNRLRQHRQEAREQTRNTMEFGNEDNAPGPNYGVQQSTGTDVRMKPGNIMEQAQYPNMALGRGDDPKQVAMQHPSMRMPRQKE